MPLFDFLSKKTINHLPYDGEVFYHGSIFDLKQAQLFKETLMNKIEWRHDETIIFGKKIITKRKVAWYGDKPYVYTYSHVRKSALLWTDELLVIKDIIEKESGETFNSCLLNLYHTGEEGMAYHSDDEFELKKHGAIASVSFGADRKFSFRHKKTKERIDILLENGSLLMMKGVTQSYWAHKLPPTKKVHEPRINLTFRTIEENRK